MKKILLVEDDIALSAGLCFELEEEDYLTVAAHSLKKAGQLLETSKFDLLLLDVDLPDGNGFTFYKEIKKTIYRSGYVFDGKKRRGGCVRRL